MASMVEVFGIRRELRYVLDVSLASELDQLPTLPRSPGEKLLEALALYDEGLEMQRLALRRRFPDIGSDQLENLIQAWLRREGPDEAG